MGNGLQPDDAVPLVLSSMDQSGARITAANIAAEAIGLFAGMPVADARAIHPALAVEAADPEGDAEALTRLALWCRRYSPLTRADPPDGLCIDITGCAHLFGGEERMARDLQRRLDSFGLTARLAITPTIGAGWAAARHDRETPAFIASGEISVRLAAMPVSALRLEDKTIAALNRVGLKTVGLLIGKPRAPLVTRFGPLAVLRLDQALGLEDERFHALTEPPDYRAEYRFGEPVISLEAVKMAVDRITCDLSEILYRAGKAARRIELVLYRVDGWHDAIELRILSLSRDAGHLARLLGERLERLEDHAGFGFETVTLGAYDTEDAGALQHGFTEQGIEAGATEIAPLLDRLANRFGPGSVVRFLPRASYIPERAAHPVSVLDAGPDRDWATHILARQSEAIFVRPVLLLTTPEPVKVLVEMPDRPPARFEWRHVAHRVTRADGPERIAPEWWVIGNRNIRTRDYYRVEDEDGRRFWLFRDGLYDRAGDDPDWYIHGVFA
jgi:protein ImuB